MSELKATPGPWFVHDNHPQHACYHIGPEDCGPLDVPLSTRQAMKRLTPMRI